MPSRHSSFTGLPAREILSVVFGYESFRGDQAEIIRNVIEGNDALVLMPTGGGKSLCYQIPALAREGVAVVISPLIALMRDQVQELEAAGVRAAALNSDTAQDRVQSIMADIRKGTLDLLYVAPERFQLDGFQAMLAQAKIALFAIDEAHCISQWGHDFRPSYLEVGRVCSNFPGVPRLALTGTADANTERDMIERLGIGGARIFRSSFVRPNLSYTVTEKNELRLQIRAFLEPRRGQSGILYCGSRKRVDEMAEFLRKQGHDAIPYHAGLDRDTRAENQDRFIKGEGVITVATVAFGMGINKPDVRFVVHADMPGSVEAYYQETGRAGRDGLPADTLLLYSGQDILEKRRMIDSSEGDERHKALMRQKLNAMAAYTEGAECRRSTILRFFGETPTGGCGQCDRCLNPVETIEATREAQMLLSACARTGERYGQQHLLDVVMGERTKRAVETGHTRLPTFGVGADRPREFWRHALRQAQAAGFFGLDQYSGLTITDEGREVLRGHRQFSMVKPSAAAMRPAKAPPRGPQIAADLPRDRVELFEALRALRSEIAREQHVPPYVVFTDRTLIDMVGKLPPDIDSFGHVSGVGEAKRDRYGPRFLEVISRYQPASAAIPEKISVPMFPRR